MLKTQILSLIRTYVLGIDMYLKISVCQINVAKRRKNPEIFVDKVKKKTLMSFYLDVIVNHFAVVCAGC